MLTEDLVHNIISAYFSAVIIKGKMMETNTFLKQLEKVKSADGFIAALDQSGQLL